MNRNKKYITLLIVFFASLTMAQAQKAIPDSVNTNQIQTVDSSTYYNDSLNTTTDSITTIDTLINENVKNIKKQIVDSNFVHIDSVEFSLNAFLLYLNDSITVEKWKYNNTIHNFDIFEFDSTLKEFHISHPAYKQSINNTYLGNSGLASKSNIYFDPNPETNYLFLKSFSSYLHQANNSTYYNTQKPFTLFGYNAGPKEEQNIEVIHTQNVNKYFNAFIKYNNYSGIGHYIDQQTKNNSGTFGGSHVRNRFSTHLSFTFSRINVKENGGIIDPYFITDTTLSPTEVGTRLNKANNYVQDRQWYIDQKVGFVKGRKSDTSSIGDYLFSLQYNFFHQKSKRIYEDDDQLFYNPITGEFSYAYENNYSGAATFDTNSFTNQEHLFRLNLEESLANILGFGTYVGIGKHKTNYTYYNKDSLFINKLDTTTHSAFLEAGIFRLKPSSHLNFYGHYQHFFSGYKQNDFTLSGMIALNIGSGKLKSKISAEGKTENKTPDYFLNRFRSNHFQWDNSFDKENITEIKGKIQLPNLQTTIGSRYALLTNHIYFDSLANPAQFKSDFNVFDAYINNTVSFVGFNLINKVNYQISGKQEVLPLPTWSFYHALYYEREITFKSTNGKMLLQLGTDVNYWTAFYASGYSPAIAQFHNQTNQKTGDYPFVGAFLNLRIKRMRIYIKGEHINYSFMKDRNIANYFVAPLYPSPRMTMKYGISWTFYD